MKTFINECISFEFNPYSYKENKYDYLVKLEEIVMQKYKEGRSSIEKDICSSDFYKDEDDNWIFKYKAVPAQASTSATYSFRHALVIAPESILNVELIGE